MQKYLYLAKNSSGKTMKGSILANSLDEAAELLRSQNYFLLHLHQEKLLRQHPTSYFSKKLNHKILVMFCRQLSVMLQSGITLQSALEVINRQTENRNFANILYELSLQLQTGKSFSAGLSSYKKILPQSFLALICVGESSGRLEEVLKSAADYLERDYQAKEKLKTAAVYPCLLLFVFLISVCIMFTIVLPMFSELLRNLQIPLPLVTRVLLFIGDIFKNYILLLILFLLFFLIAAKALWRQKNFRCFFYSRIINIPIFGRLLNELILLQFCNELSVMLSSSLTIDKSIEVILTNAPNPFLEKIMKKVQNDIRNGHALSSSLSNEKFFPPLFIQMLITGEKSGNLSYMMDLTASFYQKDVDLLYKRAIAFAEPCMIIIISVFIGLFAAAIALPMFDAASHVPISM